MNTLQRLQPNTTLQGRKYRIIRMLGQGGFGITYLALQTSLNRKVAIKELFIGGSGQAINDRRGNMVVVTNSANQASFNQQKEKFKKEALRLASLNHPNLVKVHEFFEENGTAYYVMDYIEGESLRTKLNREGALSESLVLNYIQQILSALDIAHKQSIWHLDIKPENIMVDRYGNAYLIDFGASKHVEPNSTLTTSLALAYTPGFCPPELLDLSNETPEYYMQAIKDIGPWTDIYALGATMYNLLTYSIPPTRRRLEKEGRNAFIFPSIISSSTQDMIVKMMKLNKDERPLNVSVLLSKRIDDEGTVYDFGPYNGQEPKNIPEIVDNDDNYSGVVLLFGMVAVIIIFFSLVTGTFHFGSKPENGVCTDSDSIVVIEEEVVDEIAFQNAPTLYTPIEMEPWTYYMCINITWNVDEVQELCQEMAAKGYDVELVADPRPSMGYHVSVYKTKGEKMAIDFCKRFNDNQWGIAFTFYNRELISDLW